MKNNNKNLFILAVLLVITMLAASCYKYKPLDFSVNKPDEVAAQENIDAYPALKSYIDSTAYPDFKLGAAVSLADYVKKGVMYRMVNRNFQEIVLGYAMKHGAVVQADGSLNLDNVNELMQAAKSAGISLYGHTLCWHANQNATYLNNLIAPDTTSSTGPGWVLVTANDFETDNNANYQVNGSGVTTTFSAVGEGGYGTGRALKITNPTVRANDWEVQFFLKFSPAVQVGEKYQLKMDVRSDAPVTYATQAQVSPGVYKFYDFFGAVPSTSTWSTYTKEITVTSDMATSGAIAFNLGKGATTYYIDNISLMKYSATGAVTTVDKTPEQKKQIISNALDKWISGIVTDCKGYVKAWDVVNEPMDDGNPYNLKSGIGKTLTSDEFFWQDYLGKDYAVEAFTLARKYGNPGDKLFINDYGLESNLDKCKGLIQFVNYIETNGAKVDGIGTQMHIDINADSSNIIQMFKLLAATGKLIRISELDIGLGNNTQTADATSAQYLAQAKMYKFVIDQYFQNIPAKQRYGITIWSPLDSPASSSWRAGEPIGLWTEGYVRKLAYAYVAEAIKENLGK